MQIQVEAAIRLCRHVDVFGFGVFSLAPAKPFWYGHFYDYDKKVHFNESQSGHSVLVQEMRNALYDALGVANYIWY